VKQTKSITPKKALVYLTKNFFQIIGAISYIIFIFIAFSLVYLALPCVAGTQTVNLTSSQIFGLTVIAFAFIFILSGNFFYQLAEQIDKQNKKFFEEKTK
jgi:ATP/ADP translocase